MTPIFPRDPQLSMAQWRDILRAPELTTPDTLAMLTTILKMGGEASCAELARHGDKSVWQYTALGMNFGKRVCTKCHIPGYKYGDRTVYFVIPFRGATSTAATVASTMSGDCAMHCGRLLPIWRAAWRLRLSPRQEDGK